MSSNSTVTPTVTAKKAKPSSVKADAIVVGVYPDDRQLGVAAGAEEVEHSLGRRLAQTLGLLGATGRTGEVTLLASGGALNAPVIAAVGLGEQHPSAEQMRRAAGAAIRRLASRSATETTVALALPTQDAPAIGAAIEGALMGTYRFDQYRSSNGDGAGEPITNVIILTDHPREKSTKQAVSRAESLAQAVNTARDLINTPPADLPPAEFVGYAKSVAKQHSLQLETWDEKTLAKGGYGGILAVGQGSTRPPRLVKLSYRHPKAKRHLVLVGKGITFDTGGLSLKPSDAMITMKSDMSGAAAVLAATSAIAQLGITVNVSTWIPLAENMPSGSATRPSDVVTMYGGRTVEVLNTDAEGRLVLADAMARASEDQPDLIVDVATLTGACVVALGQQTFGIFGSDELRDQIHHLAEDAGEASWPLPIPENTRERLDSKVADLTNVAGDRTGGALVAGGFLREFVGDGIEWAHLDIAGTAFNDGQAHGYTPKGGTGCGVRTLVALAEHAAAKRPGTKP